jgi:preprotein translocase subunit SecG
MTTLLTVLHVIVCLFLMLTVLLQSGKGGGMGAAFGGGNAATVFGGSGASSFLRRLTAGAVTIFMLDSMTLAFLASRNSGDALTKFGEQEQQRAKAKVDARAGALKLGSGAGSGIVTPSAPGSAALGSAIMLGSGMDTDDETMGSAMITPEGSALPPAPKATGSATTPTTAPKAAGSATTTTTTPKATPKATPVAPKPADPTPAAPTTPPAPAPTPTTPTTPPAP